MPVQAVTVINKSGVIIKNSKHFTDVFKEAKAAYTAKKAELKANREASWDAQQTRKDFDRLRLDDRASRASSGRRRGHGSRPVPHTTSNTPRRQHSDEQIPQSRAFDDEFSLRPTAMDRGYSDPSNVNDRDVPYEQDLAERGLRRRQTDGPTHRSGRRRSFDMRYSNDSVDMDLAYGDMPPALPARSVDEEAQFRGKMSKLTRIMEEANCVQHSATATIAHLQKNPDALAAVALSLAEASKIARTLAPGTLMSVGKLFPAAFALLLSPEFLIAGGLAVGVTVVMLGGYKIIKRLQNKKELEREVEEPLQLQEIEPELSNIEIWRRGIADAEASSVATTADGEFVTPEASRRLVAEGYLRPEQIKPVILRKPVLPERPRSTRSSSERTSRRPPAEKTATSKSRPKAARSSSERTQKTTVSSKNGSGSGSKAVIKGVKMLFQGKSIPASERDKY